MTPDDITRLADRAEALWQRTGNDEAYYIADELRAIVRQQGKAGGVMDEMVERQARELLAREYEREGIKFVPNAIRTDPILTLAEARAVRAIVASLAPQPKDAP